MSRTRTAFHMNVPPPRPTLAQLYDGTGPVGWVDGRGVGFTGFATLAEAAGAAWVAHVALERRRAKSRGEPAPHIEPALELLRSGDDEWLIVEGKRAALLLRPGHYPAWSALSTLRGGELWFGFELVFPPDTPTFIIESSAHVVYRGLRRSGVQWTMRAAALRDREPVGPLLIERVDTDDLHSGEDQDEVGYERKELEGSAAAATLESGRVSG